MYRAAVNNKQIFYFHHVICCNGMHWGKRDTFTRCKDSELYARYIFSNVTMQINLLIISGTSAKRPDRLLQKYHFNGT
jgi:hypothetical protein